MDLEASELRPQSRDLILPPQPPLPECMAGIPRIRLANLPTPLQEMRRLSAAIGGPKLYIKRDDLTGLAGGGNKTRKLEFIIPNSLEKGLDCLITAGGPQSNHCRQTAAAASRCGLECHLIFSGGPPSRMEGNLLLDQLLGATIHWAQKRPREKLMVKVASDLQAAGRRPAIIPVGGSNRIGALGYALAFVELKNQLEAADLPIDTIVFATSSGGTQAGLILGAALTGFSGRILGISIDQVADEDSSFKFRERVAQIANEAAGDLHLPYRFEVDDVEVVYDFLGEGYGVIGTLEVEALRLLARTEGILAGPVYTGRALGGLLEMIRQRRFETGETVLFWHTGDDCTLHAYVEKLQV